MSEEQPGFKLLSDGSTLLTQPKDAAEIIKAIEQHLMIVAEAFCDCAELIRFIISQVPEVERPRDLRILADTWRHLTAAEKAANLLKYFSGCFGLAGSIVEARLEATEKSISAEALSDKVN